MISWRCLLDRVADWLVRLPTEQEWEKASRGQSANGLPYGPKFLPEGGNGKHTGLGATSPIGAYPAGASPYGVLDLSGNVWEWMLSSPDDAGALASVDVTAGTQRLIRGGCYANAPGHMKSTYRSKAGPGATFDILGLRVFVDRGAVDISHPSEGSRGRVWTQHPGPANRHRGLRALLRNRLRRRRPGADQGTTATATDPPR